MSDDTTFTWPRPYLLELYQRAVEEGCIRVNLQGETEAEREHQYKSLKGAFYRVRRRKDGNYMMQVRAEFQMVQMRYERLGGTALLIYSKLPDNQTLPTISSVKDTVDLPQPAGAIPSPTPETAVEDYDADAHVSKLIGDIDLTDDDEADDDIG